MTITHCNKNTEGGLSIVNRTVESLGERLEERRGRNWKGLDVDVGAAHLEQVVAVTDELRALLVPGKGVAATLPPPSLHNTDAISPSDHSDEGTAPAGGCLGYGGRNRARGRVGRVDGAHARHEPPQRRDDCQADVGLVRAGDHGGRITPDLPLLVERVLAAHAHPRLVR